ncbi:MAG: LysR family transcriptional regulator [Bdellovibrionales bacterium]|nr:LysR family transcriptional regulator [Bdellovibrionales bacterium]
METDRLRAFRTIVDCGSLTRAAEILNISHSGLSKAMSALRQEVGFEIFRPQGRGIEITERGRDLYNKSQKILEMIEALKEDKELTEKDILKIGIPEVLGFALVGKAILEFKDGISLEEFDSGAIEARVLDGRLDFGFTFVPFPHPDLNHLKFARCQLATFVRKGAFKGMSLEQIPFVIPSQEMEDNPLSLKIRDGWKETVGRKTSFRTNDLGFAVEMAKAGGCAIYLPIFLANHLNKSGLEKSHLEPWENEDSKSLGQKTFRDIFLVKKKSIDETREMKVLMKLVRQMLSEKGEL